MAIDKSKRFLRKTGRKTLVSQNPYHALLVKLYRFLARRTNSKFNKVVLKRLLQTKTNRPPVSISRIANLMKDRKSGKIAVCVGTVVDDERLLDCPKLTVCALRFTETARSRIVKAGGKALSFDQFALVRPRGNNTFLIKGVTKAREVYKHFGRAPGLPGSHATPYVRGNRRGRKFERSNCRNN
ncbi:hypothetical protein ACTFIZ_009074 [Dictyostelium cf. discoideum]